MFQRGSSLKVIWSPTCKAALEESHVDPWSLHLEITESAAMGDPVKATRIFSQLKELGVRINIDDFGTGHSSLSRLRDFRWTC